ncbi:hypothetical protein QAB08_000265 [Pseudomonas aeruginosa]|nr:hypothetical protein [Pseudomonas aeruginosa]
MSVLEKQFDSKFGPVTAPENIAQQMANSGNGARELYLDLMVRVSQAMFLMWLIKMVLLDSLMDRLGHRQI